MVSTRLMVKGGFVVLICLALIQTNIILLHNHNLFKHQDFEIIVEQIKQPNILFLFTDQQRFDWIDNYYYNNISLNTPTITHLQSIGTRFINVCVGSPTCVPSRGTLASGKEYDDIRMFGNNYDFPKDEITFYKLMQENGYYTMITGKDDLTKVHGVDLDGNYRINDLGFNDQRRCKGKLDVDKKYPLITDPYAKYLSTHYYQTNINQTITNESYFKIIHECYKRCDGMQQFCSEPCDIKNEWMYQDNWITKQTLDILDNKPQNKTHRIPWFLQVNFAGPHDPFLITKKISKTLKNRTFPNAIKYTEYNGLDIKRKHNIAARQQYSLEVENLDLQFAIIINKLHEMNEYKSTIICISSDHGDMLGDADDFGKFKPWIQSTNVPLICSGPNVRKHKIINTYISLIDLSATFLDYSDADSVKSNNSMTAISLRPFLNGTWSDSNNKYRTYVSSGLNPWRLVIKQINESVTWKYICCVGKCVERRFVAYYKDNKAELLYNVAQDLYEQSNVVDKYPNVVMQMKELLPKGFCRD